MPGEAGEQIRLDPNPVRGERGTQRLNAVGLREGLELTDTPGEADNCRDVANQTDEQEQRQADVDPVLHRSCVDRANEARAMGGTSSLVEGL